MGTVSVADVIASVALIAGAALSLAAGIAVLRFPDTSSRIHAATKPQVLGIVLLMIGLGIRLGTPAVIGELVLIVVLQFLTAPVSAHLAVRAAQRRAVSAESESESESESDGDSGPEPKPERSGSESDGDSGPEPEPERSG